MIVEISIVRKIFNKSFIIGSVDILSSENTTIFQCSSLELPYNNNQHNISCIPSGIYHAVFSPPSKLINYNHIQLLDVQNRNGICLHIGNYVSESKGCILIGKHEFVDDCFLSTSKATFSKVISLVSNQFLIEIK